MSRELKNLCQGSRIPAKYSYLRDNEPVWFYDKDPDGNVSRCAGVVKQGRHATQVVVGMHKVVFKKGETPPTPFAAFEHVQRCSSRHTLTLQVVEEACVCRACRNTIPKKSVVNKCTSCDGWHRCYHCSFRYSPLTLVVVQSEADKLNERIARLQQGAQELEESQVQTEKTCREWLNKRAKN